MDEAAQGARFGHACVMAWVAGVDCLMEGEPGNGVVAAVVIGALIGVTGIVKESAAVGFAQEVTSVRGAAHWSQIRGSGKTRPAER